MFPVITIADDAPDSLEQLGTKEKFWLRIDGRRYLFKMGRPGTGEKSTSLRATTMRHQWGKTNPTRPAKNA